MSRWRNPKDKGEGRTKALSLFNPIISSIMYKSDNITMEEKAINIDKGQRLSDVMGEIPSDIILHKTVCGIGATTLELNSARNSVIIEPNVPVIKGKEQKHPYMLGVYEGVSAKDIEDYIKGEEYPKKIMTTPESFPKIKRAMRDTGTDMYGTYFLLYDECDRLVSDVDYRNTVALPTNDFFRFGQKAMVSATPIMPSDPRFADSGFKVCRIAPSYDYRQDVEIIQTNNVMTILRMTLEVLDREDRVCVFLNSTNGIESIINRAGIRENSYVFCSTESMEKLRSKGFRNVSDTLTVMNGYAQLSRYNFFTSRFYSAVDIELEYRPVVIMLTELYTAPHTMIDPETEAIQIAGRFRNGYKRLIHITNYNKAIEYRTEDEMEKYLESQHDAYMKLHGLYLETGEEGATDLYRQALKTVEYSRYMTLTYRKDFFMLDNAIREELIKSYYQRRYSIKKAYDKTGAFRVRYRYMRAGVSDSDISELSRPMSREAVNRLVFKYIRRLVRSRQKFDRELLGEIGESYHLVMEAYDLLGEKKILETGFKDSDLRAAVEAKKTSSLERSRGVVTAVHNTFNENQWYSIADINAKLAQIYRTFKIKYSRRGMSGKIHIYYVAEATVRRKKRGYLLKSKMRML